MRAISLVARVLGLTLAVSGAAAAQDGAAVFEASCATCHASADAAQRARNPSTDALRRLTPEAILDSLLNGKMRIQAVALSDAERRAVAEFLRGRALDTAPARSSGPACSAAAPFGGPSGLGEWNGWGNGGGAVDDRYAYFGVGDATTTAPGGVVAVTLATGRGCGSSIPIASSRR